MKVSVIGLGYIGLPTATMFASRELQVVGIDVSERVVDTVNKGQIHIVEPELAGLVRTAVDGGYLRASLEPEAADAFLIAVPTPFKGDHVPDVSYVKSAAEKIAPVLKGGDIVILESTSPVGTTEQMEGWLAALRPDLRFPSQAGGSEGMDVHIAYCPERVLPGYVVRELVENDRIIGGMSPACSARAIEVYRTFVRGELIVTDARTAEMCKLTENAYRDVNIGFANELSLICDKLGINVWELISLANHHPRVNILKPGCGVGGHCIAVDPWFIVNKSPGEARLIRTAREVNDGKPGWVVDKIRERTAQLSAAGRPETELTIALLGLAFKPDIDDLRESPAVRVAKSVRASMKGKLVVVEPNIKSLPAGLDGMEQVTLEQALAQADVVVVLVAHSPFIAARADLSARPHVVDVTGALYG
jgi:UDP-N-acetyl-D-mannosaminuronic acid dehydrogenase